MYSLLSIFLVVPLIFSHTFAGLGEYFIIENGIGNFESVKVSIFFILLLFATLEWSITQPSFLSKKTLWTGLLILGFITLEYIFFGSESFFGIGEKQHGSLFFGSLIWFGYLLSYIKHIYFPLFHRTIVFSGLIVALAASIEYLFSYNIFSGISEEVVSSWGSGRSTASLGNPNYVAGYLIIILPLVNHIFSKFKKVSAFTLMLFGIISTGSFIGIFHSLAYIFIILFEKFFGKSGKFIAIGSLLIGIIFMIMYLGGSEKMLSLTSRFILMREILIGLLDNLPSIIIGNGPNGIIEYFDGIRSQMVDSYFPSNMIIDSSHNLFFDLLFKFGVLSIIVLVMYLWNSWNILSHTAQNMLILGILFFSFNVTILSAYILMIFALLSNRDGTETFAFWRH